MRGFIPRVHGMNPGGLAANPGVGALNPGGESANSEVDVFNPGGERLHPGVLRHPLGVAHSTLGFTA